MSDKSLIEWTQATWNVILGCSKVSPGCRSCYAIRDVHRLAGNPNSKICGPNKGLTVYTKKGGDWSGEVRMLPERLAIPLRWTQPTLVFVNSLSDMFHKDVSEEFIQRVFAVIRATPWNTYQMLTKRADRLAEVAPRLEWPKNLWMGVSVESQRYVSRVDRLRATGAAVKFLSVEPLLGSVKLDLGGIGWVITGAESGPKARPFNQAWAIEVRDQCEAAGVPFFHKQNGGKNKTKTGRLLDGKVYDAMPPVSVVPILPRRERLELIAKLVSECTRISLDIVE